MDKNKIKEIKEAYNTFCDSKIGCEECELEPICDSTSYIEFTDEKAQLVYNKLVKIGFIKELINTNTTDTDNTDNIIKENTVDLEAKKHLNGYIFDSLMYRYQLARERQLMWEITKENVDPVKARERFARDLVRFREILEEVMDEHD